MKRFDRVISMCYDKYSYDVPLKFLSGCLFQCLLSGLCRDCK